MVVVDDPHGFRSHEALVPKPDRIAIVGSVLDASDGDRASCSWLVHHYHLLGKPVAFSDYAEARATVSMLPPVSVGTITLIGRSGYSASAVSTRIRKSAITRSAIFDEKNRVIG